MEVSLEVNTSSYRRIKNLRKEVAGRLTLLHPRQEGSMSDAFRAAVKKDKNHE